MNCISINYKNAPIEIREKVAFSKEIQIDFLNSVSEFCVLLCTCNRTEVYFTQTNDDKIIKLLEKYGDFPIGTLSRYLRIYHDEKAIEHLFRVCCGIESMVLGEDEILGQIKSAFEFSKQHIEMGYELNVIFRSAVTCAKKIKTCTKLSKTSVSVATLVANKIASLKSKDKKIKVLLIGSTGKIGNSLLKNLLSYENIDIILTLRNHNREFENARLNAFKTIDYRERKQYYSKVDCIVSATTSPHFTVTYDDLCDNYSKNLTLIDIAVPPDIDKSCEKLSGIIFYDIDYFNILAKENNDKKLNSVISAEEIIQQSIDDLKKEMAFHFFLPKLQMIKKSNITLEQMLFKVKAQCSSDDFINFINILELFGG